MDHYANNMTYMDRRSLLSPWEMMSWQTMRRDVRGKLLEIPGDILARRMVTNIRNLGALEQRYLSSGHYLIVSLIPFRSYAGMFTNPGKDGYAFIVLHEEQPYLIDAYDVLNIRKSGKVSDEPRIPEIGETP